MKKLPLAFAALLFPAVLLADSVNVTFDAALTNGMGWAYSDKIKFGKEKGRYYASSQGAKIDSAQFDFNITSVLLRVSTTASCTRNLILTPAQIGAGAPAQSHEFTYIPKNAESDLVVAWDAMSQVRSFSIETTTGAQNLYFHSAVVSGEPIVEAPTNLRADDVSGTRFRLSWTNSANTLSNRVDVSRVVAHAMAGEILAEYDFAEFANPTASTTNRTDDFIAQYPAFAGSSLIYLPTNTSGIIQISTDSQKGYLVHSGFADCSEVSLLLSLKIPNDSQGKTFGIGYETEAGATNEVAAIPMSLEFKTNLVSLAGLPADAPIIFNTQGANSKRRVVVDYLAFVRGFGPAYAETNLVKTVFATGSEKTVKGLELNSAYVAQVTAFGAEGNMSPPSEPLAFETNSSGLPLTLRLR